MKQKKNQFTKESNDTPQQLYESLFKTEKVFEKYKKPDWAVKQVIRESGLVEDICEHFCSHPNLQWLKKHDPKGKLKLGVHCCDNCCGKVNIKKR